MLVEKGNHTGAIHHLKQVLKVDSDFLENSQVEKYFTTVSCRQKFSVSESTTSSHEVTEVI